VERGEVWLVALPFGPGREQQGHRPAAVLQDETHGRGSPLVLVVPLTSQLAALRFPATVRLDPSTENGLDVPSVAMVFQLRALDRTRFTRRIGRLGRADLRRVERELRRLAGLGD
jgi:mRNA interferase MazF